jgi:hypothetical protein
MKMNRTILSATVSAALIALAGAAYAADSNGGSEQATSPPAIISPSADAPANDPIPNEKPALPPESIVGMNVVNAEGDKVGDVEKIAGDQVIVSVGGFLEIGEHNVALPWSKFTTNGTGADANLQVAVTKDELKDMPTYKDAE